MPAGRPREVSLSPEEMIELGKEMVEWVKINKPLHLSMWYTVEKMFTYNEWKQFKDKKEFHPYYEIALKLVGQQYLDKDSKINPSISQRWQRVYFKDLKEEEDETAAYNASLKNQEALQRDEEAHRKLDALNEAFNHSRKASIKDCNNSNTETIS